MQIINSLKDKKIALLGFGTEGKSSYHFIRKHLPDKHLAIHDQNIVEVNDPNVSIISGENYLQNLNDYDIILKTPGISFAKLNYYIEPEKISSQTALFLQYYGNQTIGITGTKGKSTTASLIHHILQQNNKKTILAGNIGVPFFDIMEQIDKQTIVVAELSAHQLEFVRYSPHIAVLLNLYQEHLDHFNSFSSYGQAKLNITKYQNENDILVYNEDDEWITKQITQHNFSRNFYPYSNRIKNNAAFTTCKLLGISEKEIETAFTSFIPLEHRQEFVGEKHGIRFYNDSIATVPEATIFALETLKEVNTLILGGFDRGIDYNILYDYLEKNPVENIVFMGPAGERMRKEWEMRYEISDMRNIINFAIQNTQKGKICLLSPAAASYDQYTNFEERGKTFKQCILQPFSLKHFNSFHIDVSCDDFICINKEEEFDYLFAQKIFQTPFLILGGGCNILFTKDFNGTVIHINTKGINIIEENQDFVTIEVKSGENWEDFIDFCTKNRFFGIENLSGIPGKVGSCPVQNIGAYGVEVKDVIREVHTREIATGNVRVFTNEECKFGYRDSIFKNVLKNKVIITSVVFQLSKVEVYNLSYKALREELEIHPNKEEAGSKDVFNHKVHEVHTKGHKDNLLLKKTLCAFVKILCELCGKIFLFFKTSSTESSSKISLSLITEKVKEIRSRKLPDVEQIGSAGSFFKNPVISKEKFDELKQKYPQLTCFELDETSVKLAAAQLIEISGWKGFREGDAGVYPHQPLVLVNYGNATGEEIVHLAKKIQQSVFDNFGVELECEVQMI